MDYLPDTLVDHWRRQFGHGGGGTVWAVGDATLVGRPGPQATCVELVGGS